MDINEWCRGYNILYNSPYYHLLKKISLGQEVTVEECTQDFKIANACLSNADGINKYGEYAYEDIPLEPTDSDGSIRETIAETALAFCNEPVTRSFGDEIFDFVCDYYFTKSYETVKFAVRLFGFEKIGPMVIERLLWNCDMLAVQYLVELDTNKILTVTDPNVLLSFYTYLQRHPEFEYVANHIKNY